MEDGFTMALYWVEQDTILLNDDFHRTFPENKLQMRIQADLDVDLTPLVGKFLPEVGTFIFLGFL